MDMGCCNSEFHACKYVCIHVYIKICMNLTPYEYNHYLIHKLRHTDNYMSE